VVRRESFDNDHCEVLAVIPTKSLSNMRVIAHPSGLYVSGMCV
jgi:hypothetical protein